MENRQFDRILPACYKSIRVSRVTTAYQDRLNLALAGKVNYS